MEHISKRSVEEKIWIRLE